LVFLIENLDYFFSFLAKFKIFFEVNRLLEHLRLAVIIECARLLHPFTLTLLVSLLFKSELFKNGVSEKGHFVQALVVRRLVHHEAESLISSTGHPLLLYIVEVNAWHALLPGEVIEN